MFNRTIARLLLFVFQPEIETLLFT